MTAIKERPILFSGPMVRAILDGRKTVTRRVMKPQPTAVNADDERGGHWWPSEEHQSMLHIEEEMQKWTGLAGHACPYGEPGHRLRVSAEILLEITDVRVERLQAGEGETAYESRYVAEGINRIHHGDGEYYFHPLKSEPGPGNWIDPFDAWRELWVSIKGGDSWNENPWVWVVEFKRVT